jgi:hypothetical protein
MSDSDIQSLINYVNDALNGNNAYLHSDSEFKNIVLSDMRYQISEINPKTNPSELKRLKSLFYQLENLGKEAEPANNIVEFKRKEKSIPANNIREFKRSKSIA